MHFLNLNVTINELVGNGYPLDGLLKKIHCSWYVNNFEMVPCIIDVQYLMMVGHGVVGILKKIGVK